MPSVNWVNNLFHTMNTNFILLTSKNSQKSDPFQFMHGFSTFCMYIRHMPYCANKFWSLNIKRFKPSFLLLLLAYL